MRLLPLALLKLLCLLGGFGLCISPATASGPLNLEVLKRDGYGAVSLHRANYNFVVVEAAVDGQDVRLVLDTAFCSQHIMLGKGAAQRLQVATRPTKEAAYGFGGRVADNLDKGIARTVAIGDVQISQMPLFFGSFSRLPISYGYLGLGFLRTCSAIVDLPDWRLYLRPPRMGRTPIVGQALKAMGLAEARLTVQPNVGLLVDVEVNGAKGKMIVDTGEEISSLDDRFASQAKLRPYRSTIRLEDISGSVTNPDWDDPERFAIDGVEAQATRFVVKPMSLYSFTGGKVVGMLGMDFLGQRWSIIDLAQQKIYFAPQHQPPQKLTTR